MLSLLDLRFLSINLFTLYPLFLDLIRGHFALQVSTWKAFISVIQAPSYITSKRQNAVVHRITQIVMTVVTTKMLPFRSITRVGVSVNEMDTTWLASIKAAAMSFTALKNSDAAR